MDNNHNEKDSKEDLVESNFEAMIKDLEQIVNKLEKGSIPLEKALELFEEGIKISRNASKRLSEAERKIEVLLKEGDTTPYDQKTEDESKSKIR